MKKTPFGTVFGKQKAAFLFIIGLLLIVCPIYAIEECKPSISPDEIPCQVFLTWQPPNACTSYTVTIYNESAQFVAQSAMAAAQNGYCYTNLTNSSQNTYYLNITSGDTATVIVEESDNMIIAALILLPMLFSIVLLYGALKMGEQHNVLKIFFFMLVTVGFWQSLHTGLISVIEFYPNFTAMQDLIGFLTLVSAWMFWLIMAYWMLMLIYTILTNITESKRRRREGIDYD